MTRLTNDEDVSFLQNRIPALTFVVIAFCLIILARLFYLQVLRGPEYRHLSAQISVREEEIRARRGDILDRKERVLAASRPYYEVVAIPQDVDSPERVMASLSEVIPVPAKDLLRAFMAERPVIAPFQPVTLVADAPYEWVATLRQRMRPDYDAESPVFLNGIEVRVSQIRFYLYPELFSHVLGYMKEIDREGLVAMAKTPHADRYSLGDLIGAAGIEATHDLSLRGSDGVSARVVDARGKEIRHPEMKLLAEQSSLASFAGSDLKTSLDYETQWAAQEAMAGRKGSVVALEPYSGQVLALYSSPGYDPNRITKTVDRDYWRQINLHPDKFLFNRAIQGTYPPGSVYKIVGAMAGLTSGKITPETKFHCGGGLQFGNRFFRCWRSGGHGTVEIRRGLTQSCDVFFYQNGLRVGVDGLNQFARLFGLAQKTGIDLPFEQGGLIPTSAWKEKRFRQKWIESETLSIAIGQGYDLVTPLQNARMIAMVANGGRPITPRVAAREPASLAEPVMNPDTIALIQGALIDVVHGEGTARRLKASPNKIAGKTGTSQVVGRERGSGTGKLKPHGLFVAFAPYDDPKIAVSVIVENAGGGGAFAAPVAMAVIDAYLGKKVP